MPELISNTSPLLYLYRINGLDWLPALCGDIRVPTAVARELSEGRRRGYDVPDPCRYEWITIADPRVVPSVWLNLDLGPGELAVLSSTTEVHSATAGAGSLTVDGPPGDTRSGTARGRKLSFVRNQESTDLK